MCVVQCDVSGVGSDVMCGVYVSVECDVCVCV